MCNKFVSCWANSWPSHAAHQARDFIRTWFYYSASTTWKHAAKDLQHTWLHTWGQYVLLAHQYILEAQLVFLAKWPCVCQIGWSTVSAQQVQMQNLAGSLQNGYRRHGHYQKAKLWGFWTLGAFRTQGQVILDQLSCRQFHGGSTYTQGWHTVWGGNNTGAVHIIDRFYLIGCLHLRSE